MIAVTKFSGVVVYWYYGDTLLNPHIRYGREHLPSRGLFRLARIARLVVPGLPHHVTQRGNRRMNVFFSDDDHLLYLDLLKERCRKAGVEIWSYCLMPNHVHLILNPSTPQALGLALGETHRRYSSVINARLRVTGHLFQSRYGSAVMDEEHLMAAARYVALNPVRRGWSRGRRTGGGRAFGRIWRARTTAMSPLRRSWSAAPAALPISSIASPIRGS